MKHYFRLLRYLNPYRREVAFSVVCNVLMVLFSLGSMTILIPVLQIIFNNTRAVAQPPVFEGLTHLKHWLEDYLAYLVTYYSGTIGKQGVLLWVIGIAGSMFILKNIFRYLAQVFLVYIKNGVERDLRNQMHRKILDMPLGQLSGQRKGDIIARLTSDILEIQWALFSSIQRLVEDPLMILLTIVLLITFSFKLTLFVVVLIPITGFIITTIGNSLKRPSERAKEELGRLMSYIEENIGGLAIIKSYVAEDRIQNRFEQSNHNFFRNMNQMLMRRELSSPISEILGVFIVLATIGYGSYLILDHNELQPEVFITYIILFFQIINPAKSLSVAIYDIKRGEASSSRIFELLDMPNPVKDRPDALAKDTFTTGISLEQVSFRYQDKWVVRDFTLDIPKGRTIALVGQSGSGKSTLVNLLNRFYDVGEGRICIDGVDIRDLRQQDLRRMIGYISQEAILFHDSIRNNLLLGKPDAGDAELEAACRVANALDFVLATEQGFETNIGDRGNKLSGGQRQRLTIARAVLKNPPILILDEATSALDSESEKLVQEALTKLMAHRTSIVIAHRLSTIQHADWIVVMREGSIVEQGTHDSLMARQGEYRKLVELQSF